MYLSPGVNHILNVMLAAVYTLNFFITVYSPKALGGVVDREERIE